MKLPTKCKLIMKEEEKKSRHGNFKSYLEIGKPLHCHASELETSIWSVITSLYQGCRLQGFGSQGKSLLLGKTV